MGMCVNCSTALNGPFCHMCGQKERDLTRPLSRLVRDLILETFDIDGRTAKTVRLLFTQPGLLTEAYLKGRRQAYTPPLRLYLVASVLFFAFVAWVVRRGILFDVNAGTVGEVRALTEVLPQMMFVFLPVFAVLLKLLQWRRNYLDHLIHALHLHTAAYMVLFVVLPFERAADENLFLMVLQFTAFVYLGTYLLISFRRVYGSGWPSTVAQVMLLLSAYVSLMAVSLEIVSAAG